MQIHGSGTAMQTAASTPAATSPPPRHPLQGGRDSPTPGRATEACAHARHAADAVLPRYVKLIAAAPRDRVGDRNQARAVAAETMRALVQAGLHQPGEISCDSLLLAGRDRMGLERALTVTLKEWTDRIDFSEYERLIFILAGSDHALAGALGDVPTDDIVITAYTGHKLTDDIIKARHLPSVIALPASAITDAQRDALASKTTLELLPGVAHDVDEASIATAARDYRTRGYPPLPPIDGDTVSILLGGDVVEESEDTVTPTLRRLGAEDARMQAHRIAKLELAGRERCRFVIVSSPRTGKFGPDGVEISPNPHRAGIRDEVTRAFEEALRGYPNVEVQVFDFQHRDTPSAYRPLLHAYREATGPTGRIHVPGDSVSMVSEVASLLPGTVVIDETASMADDHRRAAAAIAAESGIAILRGDGSLQPGKGAQATPPVSAARRIADAIVTHIRDSAARRHGPEAGAN